MTAPGRGPVLLASNAPEDDAAGAAGALLQIDRQLRDRGWEVVRYCAPAAPPWPRRVDRQLTYVRVPAAALRVRPIAAVVSSGDGALLSLARPRLPLISHSQGLEHLRRRACAGLERDFRYGVGHRWVREPAVAFTARRASALVVQNPEERDFAVQELGVDPRRARLIPNGVDSAFFELVPGAAERPTVLWIGSWIDRKGRGDLPGILAGLVDEAPTAVLHLLGTGVDPAEVVAWFPPELRSRVRVTARTDRAGVRRACTEAWVGLTTSRFEGFALSVVEMMAAGLPVVATPAGGVPALVDDWENGVRVGVGDRMGTAAGVARLLTSAELRRRLGEAARRTVAPYRWERIGEQWSSLLEEVTAPEGPVLRPGRRR